MLESTPLPGPDGLSHRDEGNDARHTPRTALTLTDSAPMPSGMSWRQRAFKKPSVTSHMLGVPTAASGDPVQQRELPAKGGTKDEPKPSFLAVVAVHSTLNNGSTPESTHHSGGDELPSLSDTDNAGRHLQPTNAGAETHHSDNASLAVQPSTAAEHMLTTVIDPLVVCKPGASSPITKESLKQLELSHTRHRTSLPDPGAQLDPERLAGLWACDEGNTMTPISLTCRVEECEPEMSHIADFLYLGGVLDVFNAAELKKHNITHFLNVSRDDVTPSVPNCIKKHVPMLDSSDFDISSSFDECFGFIDEARRLYYSHVLAHLNPEVAVQGKSSPPPRLLVHCQKGRSRSVTVLAAYLVARNGWCVAEALGYLSHCRPCAEPNPGFANALANYQAKLSPREREKSLQQIAIYIQNVNKDWGLLEIKTAVEETFGCVVADLLECGQVHGSLNGVKLPKEGTTAAVRATKEARDAVAAAHKQQGNLPAGCALESRRDNHRENRLVVVFFVCSESTDIVRETLNLYLRKKEEDGRGDPEAATGTNDCAAASMTEEQPRAVTRRAKAAKKQKAIRTVWKDSHLPASLRRLGQRKTSYDNESPKPSAIKVIIERKPEEQPKVDQTPKKKNFKGRHYTDEEDFDLYDE